MIINADILEWAASYDGPLSLAFVALKFSISYTVTGITERYKVARFVCFFVALHAKQAEWPNVMYTLTSLSAMLAGVAIPLQCLAALRLPIWATIVITTVNVLRMIQAMPMRISTWARAIFTAALTLFQPACANSERFTAVKAIKRSHLSGGWARFNSSVLASWRAVFTPTMFQSAWALVEYTTALRTSKLNLYDTSLMFAHKRTELRSPCIRGFNLEFSVTILACKCNHIDNYTINCGTPSFQQVTI